MKAEKHISEDLFLRKKPVLKLPDHFEQSASITMGAAGDLIQADGLESSKNVLFDNVADILFGVDVSFANYESPVTEQKFVTDAIGGGRPPIMCCSFAQFSTLTSHEDRFFTALNTANNHIFDLGIDGLETTQKLFTQHGIIDVGTPRDRQEYGRAKILSKGTIKIGFISATFGLNGHELPLSETYRIHTAKLMSKYVATDLTLLKMQIDDCKKQDCDFIVASIHWGYEFEFFPRHRQILAAHTLAEEGVDLILGHHPHVIQPIEYYRTTRDPNRIAIIAYSLGSLTWGWYTAPHLTLSMILNLRLAKGVVNGAHSTYIENIQATPVFRDVLNGDGPRLMRIEKLHDGSGDRRFYHSAGRIKQMKRYADLVLGGSNI